MTDRPEARSDTALPEQVEELWTTLQQVSPHTAAHCERVVELSRVLGVELALRDREMAELAVAARYHDVGECFLPRGLAGKPLAFTTEERALMERHADLGADALQRAGAAPRISDAVRFHHERWDGSGYPRGLVAEDIPRSARILHLCEAWDAMRSNRAYAALITKEEALDELAVGAGRQFDPAVARVGVELFSATPG